MFLPIFGSNLSLVCCPSQSPVLNISPVIAGPKGSPAATSQSQGHDPPTASLSPGGRGRSKRYLMCVCTMIRNQARFMREWVTYHAHIGVQRWFVYDNASDDDIDQMIRSIQGYNVAKHAWPWIKTQEAGFSHCFVLASHESCQWVAFIDVDEFLYYPTNLTSTSMEGHLKVQSSSTGKMRVACRSFGPSDLSRSPERVVMVGYTCRMSKNERHKSIVRPEAIHSALMNAVHHFYLKDGYEFIDVSHGEVGDKSLQVSSVGCLQAEF